MADILIRGMEMPKDENSFVKLMILNDGRCFVAVGENEVTSKTGIVTARELPEGHGRLIDADNLLKEEQVINRFHVVSACDVIIAPTIVPAEGGVDDGE